MSGRNRANATASIMVDIQANSAQAKGAVNDLIKSFDKLKLGDGLERELKGLIKEFNSVLGNLEARATKGISSKSDAKSMLRDYDKLQNVVVKLQKKTEGIANMPPIKLIDRKEIDKLVKAKDALVDYEKALKHYNSTEKSRKRTKELLDRKQKAYDEGKSKTVLADDDYKKAQKPKSLAKRDATNKENEFKARQAEYGSNPTKEQINELRQLEKEAKNLRKAANEAEAAFKKFISQTEMDKLTSELESAQKKVKEISGPSLDALIIKLKKIGAGDFTGKSFDEITQALQKMESTQLNGITNAVKNMGVSANKTGNEIDELGRQLDNSLESFDKMSAHQQDVDMLTGQVRQFFSFTNGIYIFRQAVRDAIETVKELDAAMTETAVVTDYSISDMWKQLPQYTKKANELGATTKGVYETMTLYFQQGLSQDQAFAVGEETLKMARIAGLDYASATDLMTSALRGFNMTIDETNSKRINDVYSELAAITAADTYEIATAMTKVASIANSANMSFENTSAFLSQIIETTREAPETAGTALKTIIARFSEVKKMVKQGSLSGVDGEGEAIEINKIDTALQSVGISLKDFISGRVGLDEIFLQLAQKWDSLDLATQRYIATTAAGSRQQSRFIAMMSDYDRTLELVDSAYNSAGSSQRQFDKTLESLDAKLNKLKNAWDQFVMGIANNEAIKGGVDLLTNLLNVINKVSDAMGNSMAASIAKVAIGIGALKTGGNVVDRIIDNYTQLKTGKIKDSSAPGGIRVQAEKRAGSAMVSSVGKTTMDIVGDAGRYVAQGKEIGKSIQAGIKEVLEGRFFTLDNSFIKGLKQPVNNVIKELQDDMANIWSASYSDGESFDIDTSKLESIKQEIVNLQNLSSKASVGQLSVFNALINDGVSAETAKLALEQEITEELAKQLALKQLGDEATEDDITDKAKELFEVGNKNKTSFGKILDSSQMISAGTSIGKLGESLTKLTSKIPGVGSLLGKLSSAAGGLGTSLATTAGASTAATTAFGGLLSGLGTILPVIAAVAAGFFALKGIFDWIHDNSYEGRIEAAEVKVNDAAFAAEAAKKSYDELLENKASSEGLLSELDNLAIGTAEFNQKLLESNKLVDDLVGKNIGLTYDDVEIDNITGAKSIKEESWNRVAKQQLQKTENANAALAMAEARKKQIEYDQSEATKTKAEAKYAAAKNNGNVVVQQNAKNEISAATTKSAELATELEGYQQQIVSSLQTEGVKASGEIGKGIQQYYAQAMSSEEMGKTIDAKANEIKSKNSKIEDLQKLYAEAYSIDVDDIDESIKEDKDKLAQGIANFDIADSLRKQMDNSIKSLSALGMEGANSLMEAMATNGKGIDGETLKNINSLTEADMQKIADSLNTDIDSIKNMISNVQQNAKRDQEKVLTSIGKSVAKAQQGAPEDQSKALNSFFEKLNANYNSDNAELQNQAIDQMMALNNMLSNMESADSSVLNSVLTKFSSLSEDQAKAKEYSDFVAGINFNSAIEGASQLKSIMASGTDEQKQWAEEIAKSGKEMFSNASQMREYFSSADYSADVEKLNEKIDENGKVSSQNIKELSASSQKLKNLLSNTGMSAEALSRVFGKFQTGEIQLDKVSDAALEAMTSVQSLNDVIEESHEFIDNFDFGLDSGKAADFMGSTYEKLSGLLKEGAVGNPQIRTTLTNLFGPDTFAGIKTGEEYLARVNMAMEALENNSKNFFSSWQNLTQHKDVFGNAVQDADLISQTFSKIQDTGNDIQMSFKEGLTMEEAVSNLAKITNTNEDYARMMIEDFQNNSPDLQLEVQQMQTNSAIKTLAGGTFDGNEWKNVASEITVTEESVDALATSLGLTKEEFIAAAEASGVMVKTLKDVSFGSAESPLNVEDLKKNLDSALQQASGDANKKIKLTTELGGEDVIQDYNSIKSQLEAEGIQITPEMKAGIWSTLKQELISQAEGDVITIDGVEVPVSMVAEANSVEELQGKISEIKAEGSTIATSVTEGINNALQGDNKLDVNLKVNRDELESATKEPIDQPTRLKLDESDPTTNAIMNGKAVTVTQPEVSTKENASGEVVRTEKYVDLLPNVDKITAKLQSLPDATVNLKVGENGPKNKVKEPLTQKVTLDPKTGLLKEAIRNVSGTKEVNLYVGEDHVTSAAKKEVDKTVNLVKGKDEVSKGGTVDRTVNLKMGSDEVTGKATKTENKSVNLGLGSDTVTAAAQAPVGKTVNISTSLDSTYSSLGNSVTKYVNVITKEAHHAKGIKNSPTTHSALVGEEGPELIEKRNYSYIAGLNGPEFAQIEKGDTVYTNRETKTILKTREENTFPRYASGYNRNNGTYGGGGGRVSGGGSGGGRSSSGGSGSSAGEEKEPWKNSFDKLYNLLEDIAEEQRNQTRLQNEYKDLLSSTNTTGYKLFKNLKAQMASLQRQEDLQKQVVSGRQAQMREWLSQKSQFSQYGTYNWNDMTIEINWDKINSITDQDLGGDVEEYISQLEEWQSSMDSANDELRSIKEAIDELNKTGQNEFLELEQSIFDAIKDQEQKRIDELNNINDSLNKANDNLLSSLREAISEERQDRENKKTEESIADKERRLDYLKQDTSGANALAIKKLEEELAKDKESYTDTLIDQKIDELEQQNDEAAEQRERQINIAQANLDHMVEFGKLWGQVNGIYDDVLNAQGAIDKNSPAYKLLQELAGYKGMSDEQKKQWEEEIQNQATQAVQYLSSQNQLEKVGVGGGQTITFTNSNGQTLTGVTDGKGNVTVTDSNKNKWTYSDVYQGRDGEYRTLESSSDAKYQAYQPPKPPAPPKPQKPNNSWRAEGVAAAIWIYGANSGWGNDPYRSGRLQEKGVQDAQYILNTQGDNLYNKWWPRRNELPNYFYGAFKTGGLADFTGPAWLDGTKSRPELVLNQQDTQNFIQLKNVLASAMKNTSTQPQGSNVEFNINVEVGSIANDYDVDDMVDRIKNRLNEDAMYRNINSINLIR